VSSVNGTAEGLSVEFVADASPPEVAADLNKRLVESGVAVYRLEPARVSLEERFLEITSRLGVAP
jgi:hypothetical protein